MYACIWNKARQHQFKDFMTLNGTFLVVKSALFIYILHIWASLNPNSGCFQKLIWNFSLNQHKKRQGCQTVCTQYLIKVVSRRAVVPSRTGNRHHVLARPKMVSAHRTRAQVPAVATPDIAACIYSLHA